MPRYDPTILPTETLHTEFLTLTADIERLDAEYHQVMEMWRVASAQGASDEVLDGFERTTKNLSRKKTLAMNKRYKNFVEKLRREKEEAQHAIRRLGQPLRPTDDPHNALAPEAE